MKAEREKQRRTAACVNACLGIPTEALERTQLLKLIFDTWRSVKSLKWYLDNKLGENRIVAAGRDLVYDTFPMLDEFMREMAQADERSRQQ